MHCVMRGDLFGGVLSLGDHVEVRGRVTPRTRMLNVKRVVHLGSGAVGPKRQGGAMDGPGRNAVGCDMLHSWTCCDAGRSTTMGLWSAHRSEHHETIDEEPFEAEAESYDDWVARVREEFEKGSERFEHVDLEAAEPSYRDRPLREFRERFPGEYTEPWEISTPTEEFCSPERFVAEINPKHTQSRESQTNCCDCARSVERTWRGHRETAAGMRGRGELDDRMETWAGETYRSVGAAEIQRASRRRRARLQRHRERHSSYPKPARGPVTPSMSLTTEGRSRLSTARPQWWSLGATGPAIPICAMWWTTMGARAG